MQEIHAFPHLQLTINSGDFTTKRHSNPLLVILYTSAHVTRRETRTHTLILILQYSGNLFIRCLHKAFFRSDCVAESRLKNETWLLHICMHHVNKILLLRQALDPSSWPRKQTCSIFQNLSTSAPSHHILRDAWIHPSIFDKYEYKTITS